MEKKNCIMVFLKYPRIGEVKTRLAATIGYEMATCIYKNLCEVTFEQCILFRERYEVDILLLCASDKDIGKIGEWTDNKFIYKPQIGNDLGERLAYAFKEIFDEGYNKCIVIGTDVPEISSDIFEQAFTALDNNDYVIGKAEDGGYYVLGMKNCRSAIFEGIEWSTGTVFTKTLAIIHSMNKTVYALPILNDIDREEDLFHLQKKNKVLYSRLVD